MVEATHRLDMLRQVNRNSTATRIPADLRPRRFAILQNIAVGR